MCAPPDSSDRPRLGSRGRAAAGQWQLGPVGIRHVEDTKLALVVLVDRDLPYTVQVGPDKFYVLRWTVRDCAFCLPARRSSEIIVCPCADLKPSKAAMNLSSKLLVPSPARQGRVGQGMKRGDSQAETEAPSLSQCSPETPYCAYR